MSDYRLRLGDTDSVKSVNKDNFVDMELKQSTKLLPYGSTIDTISQRSVFEEERRKSTKYRLIATIRPYCSNVLFNALTEIVKDEGSSNVKVVTDIAEADRIDNAMGKKKPTRNDMIMNTEYSKEDIGYEYHPGFDIFNNHILRNLSFKMVNKCGASSNDFNTIKDVLRDAEGNPIKGYKRTSINDVEPTSFDKHLYINDDILEFFESISANLFEENGWFGFVNNSTIQTKERINKDVWNDMNICRALNNRKGCEFIDMYPDRTLYSFNPKYNKFRHRPEYNWHLCLTYPYRNEYNHPLLSNCEGDGKCNGMLIKSVEQMEGISLSTSTSMLMFRTYIKHGLNAGDNIRLYYSKDNGETFAATESVYRVDNVGDFARENKDYYFQFSNTNLLADLDIENVEDLSDMVFRFAKYVNGAESKYYIRIFKKLPNFKYEGSGQDLNKIEFDKEQYKLAFSSTIYGDNITQATFTDGIDIRDEVRDNWNRPLTNAYLTILKNNSGHKEWYSDGNYGNDKVEYSHCFSELTSGLNIYSGSKERSEEDRKQRAFYSDIHLINNLGCFDSKSIGEWIKSNEDITLEDDEFIGDICEFIPCQAREVLIDDVFYRFNTAQREIKTDNTKYGNIKYQEIESDDYDLNGFKVEDKEIDGITNVGGVILSAIQRPEGYYYKPHYVLPLREFGDVSQSSHYEIRVRNAKPVQSNGIYVRIAATLPSNVSVGDVILICDDAKNEEYKTTVAYVENRTVFYINPIKEINWIMLCDILNSEKESKRLKIRRLNTDIPDYAYKVGSNKYLWRNIRSVGDADNVSVPEYVFANGYFYINKDINFFLKRQDPSGKHGLYCKEADPNDVFGDIKNESNYEYKEESETTC